MSQQKIEVLVGKDPDCGHFKVKFKITFSEKEVQEIYCHHCFDTDALASDEGKKIAERIADQLWFEKKSFQSFLNENNPNLH